MELDKQTLLEEIQKRGGDHQKAADELPDKVDHEQHGDLLRKFGVDPDASRSRSAADSASNRRS